MNRCLRLNTTPACAWPAALITTALVFFAHTAFAQDAARAFPAAAKRATMQITYPPEMLLNDKVARLSPGARIRNANNMIVLSGSLTGQNLLVNYVRDGQGMVHEVWILNATEARQPRDGAVLPSNYVSDAVTAYGEGGSSKSGTPLPDPK